MKVLFLLVLSFSLNSSRAAEASFTETPSLKAEIVLGVISNETKSVFEDRTLKFLQSQILGCGQCRIQNYTPYNEKGDFQREMLLASLKALPEHADLLFFAWNEPFVAGDQALVDELSRRISRGMVLIGTAGEPVADQPSLSLRRTLLGQLPQAVIIGELNERERLPQKSYYGPEMLTAICPPKEWVGKGFGPHFFVARLTREFSKRSATDWMSHLKGKKLSSRKIWPNLDDFFGR